MSQARQLFIDTTGKLIMLGPHPNGAGTNLDGTLLLKGADCINCDADKTPCFFIVTFVDIILPVGCQLQNAQWEVGANFNLTLCLSRISVVSPGPPCLWRANFDLPISPGILDTYFPPFAPLFIPCDLVQFTSPSWRCDLDAGLTTAGKWTLRIDTDPASSVLYQVFYGQAAIIPDCTTPGFSISNNYALADAGINGIVGYNGEAAVTQSCQPCFCSGASSFNNDFNADF